MNAAGLARGDQLCAELGFVIDQFVEAIQQERDGIVDETRLVAGLSLALMRASDKAPDQMPMDKVLSLLAVAIVKLARR